jgi:hypothetical protein
MSAARTVAQSPTRRCQADLQDRGRGQDTGGVGPQGPMRANYSARHVQQLWVTYVHVKNTGYMCPWQHAACLAPMCPHQDLPPH